MIKFVLVSGALLALGMGTASAGKCTEEIYSLEKERGAASSKMNLASAPDQEKAAKFDELMKIARKADESNRERECLEAVKDARTRIQ